VTITSQTTSSYTYDDSGIRVSQTVDGSTTLYLNDAQNHTGYAQVLEEKTSSGILQKSYLLGHDVLTQFDPTNGLLYLVYDGHGSTRRLVDALGAPLTNQLYAYDTFGNLLTGSGLATSSTALTSLLYSGERRDKATGLDYLRARYYDPRTGRFPTLDPFGGNTNDPQSLHKYLYAHANPVSYVDPSGLEIEADPQGFGILAHEVFSGYVRAARPHITPDVPLGTLIPGLAGTQYANRRPDAVDTSSREYFELKPVTHSTSGVLQILDYISQLKPYDDALKPSGYDRGAQATLVPYAFGGQVLGSV
jgi:RHS repeat-associated protein